jgi:hypothetical protein
MRPTNSRGQILVIGAAAMVVLLGIAALVIDLGFGWMLQRAEQNAVDPAAIAAARHINPDDPLDPPNWVDARQAACFFVKEHGFFVGDDADCSAAGSDLYVGTPRSGAISGVPGYVEVAITQDHVTFFGRIFGFGDMTVANSAVAANGGGDDHNVNSNALVALDPSTCSAGHLTGNGQINITTVPAGDPGGYVYINSLCGITPVYGADNEQCQDQAEGAMKIEGANAILVTQHLYVRGTCHKSNANPWAGPTTEGAPQITDTIAGLVEPDPATMVEQGGRSSCPAPGTLTPGGYGCVFEGNSGYPVRLDPGVYYGGWVIRGQAKVELNPGIYYIAGGGIQMSGNPNNVLEAVDGSGGIGRTLIFSTGDPTFSGTCAQDPEWPPAPSVSIVQYARPDAFIGSSGTWTGTYESINEVAADDTDILDSPTDPDASDYYEVDLSLVDTPAAMSGVEVRYRFAKSVDPGQPIDLLVELVEGTTVVASKTESDIGAAWQDGSFALTLAEATSITDWNDLRLRFDPSATAGDPASAQISWAEVEVPPGSSPSPERRCQGKIEIVGGNSLKMKPTDIVPWAGMLMWQDGTADGNGKANNPVAKVDIGGQGVMNIAGTIYAPQARVWLRGNGASDPSDAVAGVQIIAWQFSVVGNGVLNMPYDPDELFGIQVPGHKGLVQ